MDRKPGLLTADDEQRESRRHKLSECPPDVCLEMWRTFGFCCQDEVEDAEQ